MKTINRMIRAIEARVCIRKIWRCRAGWGMMLILEEELAKLPACPHEERRSRCHPKCPRCTYESQGTVFAYYDTLEECARAEYAVHVEGRRRPRRRARR